MRHGVGSGRVTRLSVLQRSKVTLRRSATGAPDELGIIIAVVVLAKDVYPCCDEVTEKGIFLRELGSSPAWFL